MPVAYNLDLYVGLGLFPLVYGHYLTPCAITGRSDYPLLTLVLTVLVCDLLFDGGRRFLRFSPSFLLGFGSLLGFFCLPCILVQKKRKKKEKMRIEDNKFIFPGSSILRTPPAPLPSTYMIDLPMRSPFRRSVRNRLCARKTSRGPLEAPSQLTS